MVVATKTIELEEEKKIDPSKVSIPDYDETMRYFEVINLESPNQPIEFAYNKVVWNQYSQTRGHETMRFKMTSGEIYHLPQFIVDWLREKKSPDFKYERLPNGTLRDIKSYRSRYNLIEVNKPTGEISDGRVYKGKDK